MHRLKRLFAGGSAGNEQLTAVVAITGALAAGVMLATATLPAADRLQDQMSARVGFDER